MEETRSTLLVDGIELPWALTAPATPRAALLLIPGSLNSDVDGNFAPMFPGQPAMRPHAYKDLAEQLAPLGVAVLRFAKSGAGTGSVVRDAALAREKYRVFPQRVRVAEAFLAELGRRLPTLPLALAGHSEGAVVASLLAREHAEVGALVSLSGPAKPLLQLTIWQRYLYELSRGSAGAEGEPAYAAAVAIAADYAAGRPIPEGAAENRYAPMLPFFLQPDHAPYLRSLEQVDPAAALRGVRQPVLLVQGGRDTSVFPENADLLREACPKAAIERFPELQHFYKRVPEGLGPEASFALDGESDPAVARAISAWLERLD